jgi:hypothetical protein
MPREPNAVDFWRGFALITIFINHVPGIYFERFTHRNVSISDSADLFVFLAGWSMRYIVGRAERKTPASHIAFRLFGRALQIYAAQIVIIVLAIAMLAGAALAFENPLLLEWHNAASAFFDPVSTYVGLALLTHQLGYFDILPLYVVLMLAAPGIALVDRFAPRLLLPLSLAIYAAALGFHLAIPTWPVSGRWFFNPLAWQLIFVLGFVLAREDGVAGALRRRIAWIRVGAAPIVILGALIVWFAWWPDPTKVPSPRLFFVADKSYLTPMRLIQFLALVAVFSATFPPIRRALPPLARCLSLLGRNSLEVFCIGSLLSLAGQIARFAQKGDVAVDAVVVFVGVGLMILGAWLAEWRERARSRIGAQPAS